MNRNLSNIFALFAVTLIFIGCEDHISGGSDISGVAYNGHEYVDLGLPSGLKWATCNVGASYPDEYGDYYAWGEIETKSDYSSDNYKANGIDVDDISGNAQYDVARAKWGGSWRMPTKDECLELIDNCTWSWTTQYGREGYKVVGPNGNSIFFPAAGYRNGANLYDRGSYGYYWSSSLYGDNDSGAYSLYFGGGIYRWYYSLRYYGRSVRPVSE